MSFSAGRRSLELVLGVGVLTAGISTISSTAALAQVVMTEVHYDQASGEREFVELVATSGPVDMTGWTILDQDEMTYVIGRPANPTFPCLGTFTLNAGDRLVLWHGSGTSVCTGTVRQIFLGRNTFLQSAGDDLVLRDATNACKDYVAFETGSSVNPVPAGCAWTGPNPSNGNTAGRSISRFDSPMTDTDRGVDWEASGATTTAGPKSAGVVNVAGPSIACTTNAGCDDANPCTDDVCQNPGVPAALCVHNNNTAPCSDNNACTTPDACSNGACVGGPNTCGSGGVFLNEVHYDQASGEQEFVELVATGGSTNIQGWQLLDQDEMTYTFGTAPCAGAMLLNAGDRVVVWHGNGTSVCSGAVRQIFLNRRTFLQSGGDDLVLRDGTNACKDYVAFESASTVNPVPAGCSWTGPNPSNGNTSGRSISRFDAPFTDTNRGVDWEASGATTTTGPKSAGVVNVPGPPIACTTDAGCNDNNPCTDDVCQNPGTPSAVCAHTNNTASCSDNNACTTPDTCSNGACVPGTSVCACQTNANCDDSNPCTTDVCQSPGTPSAACAHTNNTASCNDNNPCTGPDTCSSGTCTSGPNVCAGAGVYLNEVNYEQASGEQEFVELLATGGPFNIQGWQLLDQDEMTYTFGTAPCAGAMTLNTGDRVVIWNGNGTSVCSGAVRQIFLNRGTFLQSGGDDLVLRDNTNACKDYVAFESASTVNPVPAGCTWTAPNASNGNTPGRSISRFDAPLVDTNRGADWEASGATSTISPKTPGARNMAVALPFCGDGVVNQASEQCDDGNQNTNDVCSNDCTQGCGNGIVNTGETCDDGNQNTNDACSNNCTNGCGNSIVNTGEACDDGNQNTNDACSNNCTQGCGNGIVNSGEQCDDGNQNNTDVCNNSCALNPFCGDGVQNQVSEQCDDGNQNDNDTCSNNCTQGCGNGILNTGEACDDGNLNDNDTCSNNCTQGCGNGSVNTGESCDDGNTDDNDSCSNNCTHGCGNGIVNTGEQCDDGNLFDIDACSNACQNNKQYCGDGTVNQAPEQCDDGNQDDNDDCSNNCTAGCGNGIVNAKEECDDGNSNDNDACSNNCTGNCGNGIPNEGETCDDGNTNDNDTCSNNCTNGCGNGIVNTGETCDDGNTNNNDACRNTCVPPRCGDGIVDSGELCDDGNTNHNDTCSNNCTNGCGNGIVNTGEACDDGNTNNNDACSLNCTNGCGNGIVNTGEACDDGNLNTNDACSNNCTSGCGNGIVNTGEQCDDANTNTNDLCSNNCTQGCGNGILNTGEACDDGNLNTNDACSNNCTQGCGNGIVNTGELCDDANTNNNDACSNNCTNGCGNGIINTGEACDDANTDTNDACSNNCTQGCGNGIVNTGEVCDDGNLNTNDACSNNCTNGCGNAIVNTGEACDDGNLNTNDACSNNCTNGCGNAIVNTGEECDDGNTNNTDTCANNCTSRIGKVFIAEVNYDQGGAAPQEFIELFVTGFPVDITGWTLTDNDDPLSANPFTFTFPVSNPTFPCQPPFVLNAGDRMVVYQGQGTSVCTGTSRAIYLNRPGFFPATGDDLSLFDAALACKDYLQFEVPAVGTVVPAGCVWSGTNPSNGNTVGKSISRFDSLPLVDHDTAVDWEASGATTTVAPTTPGARNVAIDTDGDGLLDNVDNCPAISNANQANTDGDAFGNVCDTCPLDALNDIDGDTICGNVDNCPTVANTNQADANANGIGDVCESSGAGNVLITEVHYDQGGTAPQEFIELLATGGNVNMTGWRLTDNDAAATGTALSMTFATSDPQFPCPTPFTLNLGERLVVWQGTGTNVCTGAVRQIFLNRAVFLAGAGDDIALFDAAPTPACKDYVAFETSAAAPAGCTWSGTNPSNGNSIGTSISRIDAPVTDTNTGSDWVSSGTGSTRGPTSPGLQNRL